MTRELKFWENDHPPQHLIFDVSHVMCHMLCVTCHFFFTEKVVKLIGGFFFFFQSTGQPRLVFYTVIHNFWVSILSLLLFTLNDSIFCFIFLYFNLLWHNVSYCWILWILLHTFTYICFKTLTYFFSIIYIQLHFYLYMHLHLEVHHYK